MSPGAAKPIISPTTAEKAIMIIGCSFFTAISAATANMLREIPNAGLANAPA